MAEMLYLRRITFDLYAIQKVNLEPARESLQDAPLRSDALKHGMRQKQCNIELPKLDDKTVTLSKHKYVLYIYCRPGLEN